MNRHEMFARQKKADLLMEAIRTHGLTLQDVLAADELDWKILATAAKVNLPSVTTRNVIIDIMKREDLEADQKAEQKWEENQQMESGADRTPPRE